jgi:hypothetical protein
MLRSEPGTGKIHAGETPLECSFGYEQTGPLEITLRKGDLKTTGQARVMDTPADADERISRGEAERVNEKRLRVWMKDDKGEPMKSKHFKANSDFVVTFTPSPDVATQHWVAIMSDETIHYECVPLPTDPNVVYDIEQYLVLPFEMEAGATVLPDVCVLTVEPGFPEGTTVEDWTMQSGRLPGFNTIFPVG